MDNMQEELNSPKYTYRVRFLIPPNGGEDVVFVHADHYEYDPTCVSFIEYDKELGDPIITSSIKNWFCIERKDYDEDDQVSAVDEFKEVIALLNDTLCKYEKKGD